MVAFKDKPVILLAGTEDFLKDEILTEIKSAFLDKEFGDLNFNTFYAGSVSAEKILECARTSAFLGRKRIVFVRQVESLSASDKKLILSYVQTPHKQSLLVLETAVEYLKESFFAGISQYAEVIFCRPLQGIRLFGWVEKFAADRGKKIEKQAVKVLLNNLNNDLKLLASALRNLILYVGKKQKIELSDVEILVGPDLTTNAFELFNAIEGKNRQRAFGILDSLLKDGVNSAQILGALAHKIISERNRLKSFQQCLLNLQNTDSDIKSGRLNQRIALELLLTKLVS
ncbi:MAG: DNA polymerase III subunit delta [Candidatus Omnitrophica bacterium]|nr:DNA polymerase III subunit delta [Candidatus Omnitrophota bacterium]